MGFKTGEMTHWIMPNLKMTGFNLLSGSSKIPIKQACKISLQNNYKNR